ncbi:MAG: RusA family crossover junction endodeoxyribonuclease [Deltaproteobacteria bacterium]|nr:RusA family crossover junction endodeoxyribonuclease [Deltaproteobacteria bacterium]
MSSGRTAQFTFNLDPIGKGRPRVVQVNGHSMAFTPKKTAHAEQIIRAQVTAEGGGEFFEAGTPLSLDVEFVMAKPPSAPKKRHYPTTKPDIDNCYKLLTDALERFLYSNDSQIVDVHMRKVYGAVPCITVTVAEVEAPPVLVSDLLAGAMLL